MGISDYSIHGYWWLFYSWLFVAIIFMAIGGYLIHGYLWLFYSWLFDALLSSLLNYGIIELGGAPDFQHYKRVEGRARSPGIRLGRGTRLSSLNLHPKPTTKRVSSHSGTPLGVGTSHGHFDTQDSPRPGLGGSHHLPPYSILCATSRRLHPNDSLFFPGLPSWSPEIVPKLSRNCPGWSPETLGANISQFPSLIKTRSKPKL
jgi:hypothetical protein